MRLDSNRLISTAVIASIPMLCASVSHAQYSADFQVTYEWQGGYNADIVLQINPKGESLDGWELSWLGSPEVQDAWNCTPSQDGDRTVLEHVWYNESIDPGESVVLGFTGIGDWPPSPGDVRINGVPVDVLIDGEPHDGGGGDGGGDDGGGHGGGDDDHGGGGHGDGGHEPYCCFGDMNGDYLVDGQDLAVVLVNWNGDNQEADLDESGFVDGADLALVLVQWGSCHDAHDHGQYMDITMWGDFHGSNNNSHEDQMVDGRTVITTEAMLAYNNLRAFLGLPALDFEDVGQWAFDEGLTNNSQAWGNDLLGVGLWYAMQGAKVGWITDEAYDPQILADLQRTARTVCNPSEMESQVMDMVREYGIEGYADYLEANGMVETFINTMKMEPHHGGWMHGRCHGFLSIEGVAIAHDINHLTVLNWAQTLPFYNDTFDWPQWPALDVSDSGVIEYFQGIVVLGDPRGDNL